MSPAEDPISPPRLQASPSVLVVEDEILIRLAVSSALRAAGFEVVEAGSGSEAQSLIMAGVQPDLIFSDVMTPGMDGLAFAAWLTQSSISVPVVITSGQARVLADIQTTCPNVIAFVQKPYDEDAVVVRLREVLKG